MLDNQINDVANTVLALVAANGRVELNLTVLQGDFDIKDGGKAVLHIVLVGDLFSKVGHGGIDTVSNSFNDQAIDVIDVALPLLTLLIGTNIIGGVLHQFVNFLALASDSVEASCNSGIVQRLNILGQLSAVFPNEKRSLAPLIHDFNHLVDVGLDLSNKLIDLCNDDHSLVDEGIDILGAPLQGVNSGLERLVHLLNSVHHERLLNWEESCDDVVVHLNNKIKTTTPSAIGVDFVEKFLGTIRHTIVLEQKIFNFTEVPNEDRVEVDTNKALLSKLSLLTDEQILLELILCVLFDTSAPLFKLTLNVLISELFLK